MMILKMAFRSKIIPHNIIISRIYYRYSKCKKMKNVHFYE